MQAHFKLGIFKLPQGVQVPPLTCEFCRSRRSCQPTLTNDFLLRPTNIVNASAEFRADSLVDSGAILITRFKTFRDDAERHRLFKNYIREHHKSWETFAHKNHHDVKAEDLILVTGRDMTEDFAMLAFSQNEAGFQVQFGAEATNVASGSVFLWCSRHPKMSTFQNHGPQATDPAAHDSATVFERNDMPRYKQCVFLRGYRIRRRMAFFPWPIKAGAGPHDLGPGHRDEPEGFLLTENYSDAEAPGKKTYTSSVSESC